MRWRSETWSQKMDRMREWHKVFAWLPRKDRTHGYRMWFEFVLRRYNSGRGPRWAYRPITILESDLKSQETIDAEELGDLLDPTVPGRMTRTIRQRKKLPSQ
jgi:hypothetical protein